MQESCTACKRILTELSKQYLNGIICNQIQGQMDVGKRPWCNYVIYTTQGLSVHRVLFDSDYWNNTLLPKFVSFYNNCVPPEIISPIHTLALPLLNKYNN